MTRHDDQGRPRSVDAMGWPSIDPLALLSHLHGYQRLALQRFAVDLESLDRRLQARRQELPSEPMATMPPRPAQGGSSGRLLMDDWNEMLQAVKASLRLSVAVPLFADGDTPRLATISESRARVLDCLAALELLQSALQQECNDRQGDERDLSEAQTALMQTRASLQGFASPP